MLGMAAGFATLAVGVDKGGAVRFEPPKPVDSLVMPTDFTRFAVGRADGTATASTIVLGREFNIASVDGGASWRPSSPVHFSSVIHYFPKQCPGGLCARVRTVGGWNPTAAPSGLNFTTRESRQITVRCLGNGTVETECLPSVTSMAFDGLPRPTKCWPTTGCLRLGGTTSLALPGGRGLLLTAIVQWGGPASTTCDPKRPVATCNQSSIVVFWSDDGVHFSYRSTLADAHDYPQSLEGPNEHDVTVLPDGASLLAVVRLDGGDGGLKPPLQPYHYLDYHKSISTDWGRTWSRLAPIDAGCARPRLLALGSVVVLSGGRHRTHLNTSDVLLWINTDGRGDQWEPFSLSYHHNVGIESAGGTDVLEPFDDRVNASGPVFTLPRETNAYTSLVKVNETSALVFYDQKLPLTGDQGAEPDHASDACGALMKCTSYSMMFHIE